MQDGWMNDEEKPCDGIILMVVSISFSFCHFLRNTVSLIFWKNTFINLGYITLFIFLTQWVFFFLQNLQVRKY